MMAALDRRDVCRGLGQAMALAGLSATAVARTPGKVDAQAVAASLSPLAEATLEAGAADAPVRGVALLAYPTLAALQAATAAGCSLILSPERPLYAGPATTPAGSFAAMAAATVAALQDSPAYRAKQAFLARSGLTFYRLVPRLSGGQAVSADAMAARLGWRDARVAGEQAIYAPAGVTVSGLIGLVHRRLGATGGLRFIGDPAMPLRRILIVPGTAEVVSTTRALRQADALLTGDVREWEVVTYIHDSIAAGLPKALVATGRILSELPFVEHCGLALKQAFPELRLHAAVEPDPFWRVQA